MLAFYVTFQNTSSWSWIRIAANHSFVSLPSALDFCPCLIYILHKVEISGHKIDKLFYTLWSDTGLSSDQFQFAPMGERLKGQQSSDADWERSDSRTNELRAVHTVLILISQLRWGKLATIANTSVMRILVENYLWRHCSCHQCLIHVEFFTLSPGQFLFKTTKPLCFQQGLIKREVLLHLIGRLKQNSSEACGSYLCEWTERSFLSPSHSSGRKVNLVALNLGSRLVFIAVHFLKWCC